MVIPEFWNTLPQLRHNKAENVGPEARNDNYREENSFMDRYLSWIAQWLEHQHANLETWVQALVQDRIFLFCLLVSNAKPLHYYALRVPCRADRWRWVWSIFKSCTASADHITCGMSICIVYRRKLRFRVTVCVTVCIVLLCCVGWWWKEGRRWNPVLAHSLLFSKSTEGATRFNVPIRRTNRYHQYTCLLNIHTAEGFGI